MGQKKRKNIGSSIKQQLNGSKPVTDKIDTQDSLVLEHLEADIMYNPDSYTTVNVLGVDVIVKLENNDE